MTLVDYFVFRKLISIFKVLNNMKPQYLNVLNS